MRRIFRISVLAKLLVFLPFLIFVTCYSYSKDTFFDFNFPSRIIIPKYEYKVRFEYFISGANENDFITFPLGENIDIEIYDSEKDIWISSNSLKTSYPKLSEEMLVRVSNFGSISSRICFEIKHIKSSSVYKTPCKMFWNRYYIQKYIDLINDKILKWEN